MSQGRIFHFILFVTGLAACGRSTPTATRVPAPTPSDPAPVRASGCTLPPLPDLHVGCPELEPQFAGHVDDAIKHVFARYPELFDFNSTKGGGVYSFEVLDGAAYMAAVVADLRAQGLCAADQLEEIGVKNTNDFNEQYDILTADGFARLPPGAYIATCFPAQF
jgi:hypothetical protein